MRVVFLELFVLLDVFLVRGFHLFKEVESFRDIVVREVYHLISGFGISIAMSVRLFYGILSLTTPRSCDLVVCNPVLARNTIMLEPHQTAESAPFLSRFYSIDLCY